MSWPIKSLDEIADFTLGKMLDQKKNRGELRPYLANLNVRWGEFDLQNLREMRFEAHEEERYGLRHGDIVMCEGGEPGRCAIWKDEMPGMMVQKALHRIRVKNGIDHRFLYYSFLQLGRSDAFAGLFTGATIKHLPKEKLAKVKLMVPPHAEQCRIAEALASYDDLIENNRKRIALLEEAARLLYREWFVELRFPGHLQVAQDSGIPEGWKLTSAAQVFDVLSGGTPATENLEFWNGEIPFFTPKDASKFPYAHRTEKALTEEGLKACNSNLYPSETLFITARGTVGKLNLALVPMAMNQSCYALRSKTYISQRHLYLALQAEVNRIRSHAGGAVFDAIVVATFSRISLLLPSESVSNEFSYYLTPMFDQISNLIQQNEKLEQARDLLLPRLMRGDLVV